MTKYLLAAVVLAACTSTSTNTSTGTVTSFERSDGFNPDGGFTITLTDAGEVTFTPDNGDPQTFGVLSDDGKAQLDDLVASLPIDSADIEGGCEDAPVDTLHITFDSGGAHDYHYTCDAGPFSGLADFFSDIGGALRVGVGDDLILIAQE